jgi:hypothetical protein
MPLSGGDTGVSTRTMVGTSSVGGVTIPASSLSGNESLTGRAPSGRAPSVRTWGRRIDKQRSCKEEPG